jgi:hypothetical protein
MKRLIPLFVCAVLVALLVAESAPAVTVTVQNTQGVGTKVDWATGTTAQTGLTGLRKAGARNNLSVPTLLDPTTGNSAKIWLQFDLSSVWATYGKENLLSATLTVSKRGTRTP